MGASLIAGEEYGFANGGAGATLTLPSAPAIGDLDVLCINSDTVITSVADPAGGASWVLPSNGSLVNNQGAYVRYRIASGGESDEVVVTTSGNHPCGVTFRRYAGVAEFDVAGAPSTVIDVPATSTPAHTTPALAGNGDGLVIAFAALHSVGTANQSAPVWGGGFSSTGDRHVQGSGATGVTGFVGHHLTAGPAAVSPGVSWSGDGVSDRTMIALAFTADKTADIGLGLAVVAAGRKMAGAVADVGLQLTIAAAGRKRAAGSAALTIAFAAAAGPAANEYVPSRLTSRNRSTALRSRGGYADA